MNNVELTAPFAAITFAAGDAITDGWIIVSGPKLCAFAGRTFIQGHHACRDHGYYLHGKMVLVAVETITSITMFETEKEIWLGWDEG